MSDQPSESRSLPENANLDWLRKQAKRRLQELRIANPSAQLANAQFELATSYGFSSWRALKAHVDSLTLDGQLFDAAKSGDAARLGALLDAHPGKLQVRMPPYEWSLLHVAAFHGRLPAVDLLLSRGLDVNTRERGDNTYAMHWAAAGGYLDIVRRLADAGGDVVGRGDDHALEVIGWATCWDHPHEAVANFLVSRGARHHIFSAIAMNLGDDVRRIVASDPAALNQRMSRNENHRLPLQFAVSKKRAEMVALLVALGADPLATDDSGVSVVAYANSTDVDRPVLEKIRAMTSMELLSGVRGHRPARIVVLDLVVLLALGDWDTAARLLRDEPRLLASDGPAAGVLHIMAKRGDVAAVSWLLDHGADANARWAHWDAEVTPLHLAAAHGHAEVVRLLLGAGADPGIRDSKHDGDAIGWAEFFKQPETARVLRERGR